MSERSRAARLNWGKFVLSSFLPLLDGPLLRADNKNSPFLRYVSYAWITRIRIRVSRSREGLTIYPHNVDRPDAHTLCPDDFFNLSSWRTPHAEIIRNINQFRVYALLSYRIRSLARARAFDAQCRGPYLPPFRSILLPLHLPIGNRASNRNLQMSTRYDYNHLKSRGRSFRVNRDASPAPSGAVMQNLSAPD